MVTLLEHRQNNGGLVIISRLFLGDC